MLLAPKVKSLSELLQGAYLLTEKVNSNRDSLKAEINSEVFGEFYESISPPHKSSLFIYTKFAIVLYSDATLEE